MPRKGGNFFVERKRHKQRRKSVSRAKTRYQVEKAFTEGKRRSQSRKRVYRAHTFLAKAKARLPSENVPRKGGNAFFQEKKRVPSENAFPERKRNSERRNSLYRAKTSLANAITLIPSENVARKGENVSAEIGKAKTLLPSGNNFCKGKNAFIERKFHNRAKTFLAMAKMCLLNDISARNTRFRICGRQFRSIKSFWNLRLTFSHFSLGRRIFSCASDAFSE